MKALKKLMRKLSKAQGADTPTPTPEKDETTANAVVTTRTWNR